MIERVEEEKSRIAPGCGTCVAKCGTTDNYDMEQIWNADEDIRSLKSLLLFGIRGCCSVCIPCDGTWISVGRSELLLI